MPRAIIVAVILVALSVVVGLAPEASQQTDEDGCWKTRSLCVSSTGEFRGDRFVSSYTNNCGGRVYMRFCNETSDGEDCGASGLGDGRTKFWRTYTSDSSDRPTGRYASVWIGSKKANSDWVCAGKVRNWDKTDYSR